MGSFYGQARGGVTSKSEFSPKNESEIHYPRICGHLLIDVNMDLHFEYQLHKATNKRYNGSAVH